jgi:hypothetical protein
MDANLEEYLNQIQSTDSNHRLDVFPKLEALFSTSSQVHLAKIIHSDGPKIIGSLIQWIPSSNHKICLNSIQLLQMIVNKTPEPLKNYLAESE